MALDKQLFSVNFGQGIDTKTDEKLVVPGKLTVLENGVFQKGGRIDKRNGYRAINTVAFTGEQVLNGNALAVFNRELLQFSDSQIYSFSSASQQWVNKGDAVSVLVDTQPIVRNVYQQLQPDAAYIGNIGLFAWMDSRGGVRYTIYDDTVESPILADQVASTVAENPKVLAFNNNFYLFYTSGSNLAVRKINPLDDTGLGTEVTASTNLNPTSSLYDVSVYANQFFFSHATNIDEIKVGFLTSQPAIGQTGIVSGTAGEALTTYVTSIGRPAVVWANTGTLSAQIVEPNLAPYGSGTMILDTTTGSIYNIAAISFQGSGSVYYEITGSSVSNHFVKSASFVESTTTTGSAGVFVRSVGLASKPFTYQATSSTADSTPRFYVTVAHESQFQPTYFVIQNDGFIVAKILGNTAGGLTLQSGLPNVSTLSNGVYVLPTLVTSRVITENLDGENNTQYSLIGLARTQLDFTAPSLFTAAPLGENTHIVGGLVSIYDGTIVTEAGFNLFPENLTISQSLSGGSVGSGSYVYAAVYEWTDNAGQIHRSAPSVLQQVEFTGSNTNKITVTIPTLRLTNKPNANIVLYRTENTGVETLYRVNNFSNPTYNDKTIDSITIDDTISDDTLVRNEILYTVGGILENIAPPPASLIAPFKNRIWLAGLADGTQMWYSKERASGKPVEFNDSLTLQVEAPGGDITALAPLDDKLIVFKRDRIYYTVGEGPDDAGQGSAFAQPNLITADAGCVTPNSVVNTPSGIFFKSVKGIYRLGSDLSIEYVGAPVENFNTLDIVAAELVGNTNQVRFMTESGVALVFDYFFGQWSTFTNHYATDAVIWEDQFIFLNRDGAVWIETPFYYFDIGQNIKLALETAWMGLAGLQGYQRIYRTIMLMDYRSPHFFNMQIAYDFEQTYTDTIIFDPSNLGFSVYGSDAVYGEAVPYGGAGSGVYQFRVHMPRQKCQAIRYRFEDIQVTDTVSNGQGFSITALSLQLGTKGGLGRLRPAQSV